MRQIDYMNDEEREPLRLKGSAKSEAQDESDNPRQLTCERCGNKTDGGAWLGFVYVGAECLTKEDQEYIE